MIQCSQCGTQNRDGSKFCGDCGARLVQRSGLVCAMCGEPNTVENVFCSKCGARLVPLTAAPTAEKTTPPTPIKGLSLPAKPAESATPPAKAEPIKPAPTEVRKPDDWLARLRAMPPEEDAPLSEKELPLSSTVAQDTSPSEPEETITLPAVPAPALEESDDWIARLRTAPSSESAASPSLVDQDTLPSETPAPAAETPSDWIAQLRPASPVEPAGLATPPGDAAEITDDDLPDWLRATSAPPAQESAPDPTQESAPAPAQEPAPDSVGETPGWVTDLRAEVERTRTETPDESEDELPDWLKEAGAPAVPVVQEPVWSKPVAPAPQAPPPIPATEAEIPDWLKSLKPQAAEPVAVLDDAPLSLEPSIEPTLALSGQAKVDDTLRSIAEPQPGEELLESLDVPASPISPDAVEKPSWLTETPRTEVSEEEYLPEWLRIPSAGKSEPVQAETPTEGIPEASQVPEWIAALKPVEQPALTTYEKGPVEVSGPLAGLRGLLPLASAVTEPHAPAKPAPDSPFKETAHLFDSILATPALAPATPAAKPGRRVSLLSMRPLIYALMFLAVLIPFIVPEIANPSLRTFNTRAAVFYDSIQALPPNALVVLAFDYDPGSAGEMDLQANVLVRHLMARRVKIAAISTLETGPQIAQRVLDTAARTAGNYTYGVNYLNLGYLPGQEAGLAQVATAGFSLTARDYGRNQPLDKYPEFANLRSWRNVALLIELAGAAEPLQKWMEQVQPRAGVKIAAGVSAAADPRALAYLGANQLVAVLSGSMGAAQYEVLSNQRGLAVISAGAQSTVQLVLIAIVVIGNLVFWFSRGRGKAK